jgi:hypothetical protein
MRSQLFSFGRNGSGQCGNGRLEDTLSAELSCVECTEGVDSVECGSYQAFAVSRT